nr:MULTISPECIES: thermonuclease family protein [unclassified Mesorhizobium]
MDRYQRFLGVCWNDRVRDFGAELVRQGFAVAYRFHRKAVDPDYEKLEFEAKRQKKGLWAFEFD